MLIKQYHNIIWLQFQGVATMWCHRMTKWMKTIIISIFPDKESFLIIRFTKINHEINAPCALVGFEHSLCRVYNHLHYVSCISCWALFAYSVPQMFNCTSSAQVHGLYIYIYLRLSPQKGWYWLEGLHFCEVHFWVVQKCWWVKKDETHLLLL